MNHEEQFKDYLRGTGERITAPRLGIFRILLRQAPIGMPKLIERARADGIDPVTVYRTIELFRKLALIQEVGLGRNRLFELGEIHSVHHHHFICLSCGRILDFDSPAIETELQATAARTRFVLRGHQVEAVGTCEDCAAAS